MVLALELRFSYFESATFSLTFTLPSQRRPSGGDRRAVQLGTCCRTSAPLPTVTNCNKCEGTGARVAKGCRSPIIKSLMPR